MKKLLFLFLFFSSVAFSQNTNGIVKDRDSDVPLEGVHVSSTAIRSNTFTNEDGVFSVDIKPDSSSRDSISFSSIGYQKISISIADLKAGNYKVLLTPMTENLREVHLLTSKPLKQSLKYEKLAQMEAAVYDFASVVAGNEIYVLAGNASFLEDPIQDEINRRMGEVSLEDIIQASWRDFTHEVYSDKVQIYNFQEDRWETAPLPVRKRAGHVAVLHDNEIYILGGKNLKLRGNKEFADNTVEILNLENDSLVTDPVNPHMAIDAAAFSYKGNLMILGGSVRINSVGNKIFSDDVHMFNFDSGLWFNAGKMTLGKETVAVRLGDEVYLLGGKTKKYLEVIEVLNLVTGLWEECAKLPLLLKNPAVTAHEGIIYIYEKGNFLTYNTRSGELQNFDIDLDVEGPGLQYVKGKLYLFGGHEGNDYTRIPVKNTYSIDLEEFETTAVLSYSKQ